MPAPDDLFGGYSVNADTGDVMVTGNAPGASGNSWLSNNVWNTLGKGVDLFAKFAGGVNQIRTAAAPSGQVVYPASANPGPGQFGPYPQAQAKPAPGGAGFFSQSNALGGNVTSWVIGAVIVIVLLALARR